MRFAHYNGCTGMKATRVINAFFVLVLLTPWLCGQNPDELLVVRLPAKHGRINEPGAAPIPSPTVRGEIAGSGKDRRCGSMAVGRSSVGCCGRCIAKQVPSVYSLYTSSVRGAHVPVVDCAYGS